MILGLVCIGFLTGASAALIAFVGGTGFIAALLAYIVFGALAVVACAVLLTLTPGAPARAARPPSTGPGLAEIGQG